MDWPAPSDRRAVRPPDDRLFARACGADLIWLSEVEEDEGGSSVVKPRFWPRCSAPATCAGGSVSPPPHTTPFSAASGVIGTIAGSYPRAYERLGAGAVAVRSSATAEDLPHASFAGQHETVLERLRRGGVAGGGAALLGLVVEPACTRLPEAAGIAGESARMAVVCSGWSIRTRPGCCSPRTRSPGARTETVVDAVRRFGDVVVDGSVAADHYVAGRRGRAISGRRLPDQ